MYKLQFLGGNKPPSSSDLSVLAVKYRYEKYSPPLEISTKPYQKRPSDMSVSVSPPKKKRLRRPKKKVSDSKKRNRNFEKRESHSDDRKKLKSSKSPKIGGSERNTRSNRNKSLQLDLVVDGSVSEQTVISSISHDAMVTSVGEFLENINDLET